MRFKCESDVPFNFSDLKCTTIFIIPQTQDTFSVAGVLVSEMTMVVHLVISIEQFLQIPFFITCENTMKKENDSILALQAAANDLKQ